MNQIAISASKWLRGSLVENARDLTHEQVGLVQRYTQAAWDDPELRRTKMTFCSKLSWTIGGEYQDLSAGFNEVWISFWKTSIDILFHRPKKRMRDLLKASCVQCKIPKTIYCTECGGNGRLDDEDLTICDKCSGTGEKALDPKGTCPKCQTRRTVEFNEAEFLRLPIEQAERRYEELSDSPAPQRDRALLDSVEKRRKFYKHCLWYGLRQMIQETKPREAQCARAVTDYAERVAEEILKSILVESRQSIPFTRSSAEGAVSYAFDTNLLPVREVSRLLELRDQMAALSVLVSPTEDRVTISKAGNTCTITANIRTAARVNYLSISVGGEDKEAYAATSKIAAIMPRTSYSDLEMADSLVVARDRLPPAAQKVFDIIIDPPDDYCRTYTTNPPKRSNVAKYLGYTKREVDDAWKKIQIALGSAGIGPSV